MIIPKDVSSIRRKFAQAAVLRKRAPVTSTAATTITNPEDERVKKARNEAIKSRQELREKMKSDAEKDTRIQELQAALDEATGKLTEYEPAAKRWNEFDHKRKERLIAKFPKEEQSKVRKFDSEAIEALAEARGFTAETTPANGQASSKSGLGKIGSLKDAEKADPKAYNEFMDGIKSGAIKVDADGKVLA